MNTHLLLCPCGSGLTDKHCCALDVTNLASAEPDASAAALIERAMSAHERGATDEAERLCVEALERAPAQPRALGLLHQIRAAQGAARAADILLDRLLVLLPHNVWATQQKTLLMLEKGDLANAESHARKCIRIAPLDAQSHNLMGLVMTEVNRPAIAEHHFRRALALVPKRYPILLTNLAQSLMAQGRAAQARVLFEESMGLDGSILQTVLAFAALEERERNFARAEDLLDRAERLSPRSPRVHLRRAALLAHSGSPLEASAVLDRSVNNASLSCHDLLNKGRLLDRVGRHEEAFAAFANAKRRLRDQTGNVYAADDASDLAVRLKLFFDARRLNIMPRAKPIASGPQPVFIVGSPRSGTTMVEQALSAHPAISAGDELPLINDISRLMPPLFGSPLAYPEALSDLWLGDRCNGLDMLRDYYLARAGEAGAAVPGKRWFTDKMPWNEMHLGLIGLLFPDAPIIHLIRHPLDVVLSIYSHDMTHGYQCAGSLETIARHFALVMDLVEHYRREMTLNYLPVKYEDLVDSHEASIRRMLDLVGADFDPRCLRFDENPRLALTASQVQVTEKLHGRSRYRYRNYLKHLSPVIPILEPIISRLGYRTD